MGTALALVALCLGYLVFQSASKDKEGLKLLGQIIGIAVMVLALLCAVCATMKCISKSGCPLGKKSGYGQVCPMKPQMESMAPEQGGRES